MVSSSTTCFAWSVGSAKGKQDYDGTQSNAYVKIWSTNGKSAEMNAYVKATKKYIGKKTTKAVNDSYYSEETYTAVASVNSGSSWRLTEYSGYASVNGKRVVTVTTIDI